MLNYPSPNEISLYIHVPFCTHKCAYCHFYVIPDKDPFKVQFLKSLKQEWNHWLPFLQDKTISTVYFGGGTPALLGPPAIGEILNWIKPFISDKAEITLEANPENISQDLMKSYAETGINRVSIGIQTLDPHLLKVLERTHSAEKSIQAVMMTTEAGISNVTIDLMYDLPGQTLAIWKNTLSEIRKLPITHLSLYNLTIEPHTVFFKHKEILQKQLPDPESSLKMYEMAIELLSESGLKQYEISAFAKEGYYSRHNVGYWTGRPFLGMGPSAFSYWHGKRFSNVANLNKYSKALDEGRSPVDFEEGLEPESRIRELLAVQLRMISGVDMAAFQERYGKLDAEVLLTLGKLSEQGLLEMGDSRARLTSKGVLFYDSVASEIV